MKKRYIFILALLTACLLLTGCLDVSGISLTQAYIDSPPTYTTWFTEMPIAVTIHVMDPYPSSIIDRVTLEIENTLSRVVETLDSSPEEIGEELFEATIPWTAHERGTYKLTANYYQNGTKNTASDKMHTIYLTIEEGGGRGGAGEPEPTPLPTMPASTEETPEPWIDLWADQYTLNPGACTTLRWDAQHVDQLLLNGEAVAFTGSSQVCPDTSTDYTLRGSSAVGQKEVAVAIHVTEPAAPAEAPPPDAPEPAPADTSGPTLGSLQLSAAKVFDNPACGPDSITTAVNAQDPGGIAKVELHYRARTDSSTGAWRVKTMAAGSGGSYAAALSGADFAASLPNYTPGQVDVLVKAWDNAGNLSQSVQISFETDYCLL